MPRKTPAICCGQPDVPPLELPAPASDVAIDVLVDVARIRHGRVAIIRGLARRERDDVEALRVL